MLTRQFLCLYFGLIKQQVYSMDAKIDNFPIEIRDVEPELAKEIMGYFKGELTGFVRVGPKGYFLPHRYKLEASKIYNMPLKTDDVFVITFPRSGSTWTQELVWMINNDLDYRSSDNLSLTERYPFLESSTTVHPEILKKLQEENSFFDLYLKFLEELTESGVDQLAKMPSPRFAKSHLPLSLLPPSLLDTAKVVYVARDPRDVAVSFYHFNRLTRFQGYIGDFKTFWNYFLNGLHHWTPFFEHIKEAWEKRDHPNMLFLFYEDLVRDLPTAVRLVSKFFNKHYTDDQIVRLCDRLNIENFKKNVCLNSDVPSALGIYVVGEQPFVRNGKVGGWRDYFDEEMTEQADQWIKRNLQNTDLRFPSMEGELTT